MTVLPIIRTWIWVENLQPFVEETIGMAGEDLDEGLRFLFLDEIAKSNSDASPPRLATCEFDGPRPITAKVGIDQGTNVLIVELEVLEEVRERAETTLSLMQTYTFLQRPKKRAR